MEHFCVPACSGLFLGCGGWNTGNTGEHGPVPGLCPLTCEEHGEHVEHGFSGLICHAEYPPCFAHSVGFRVLLRYARIMIK